MLHNIDSSIHPQNSIPVPKKCPLFCLSLLFHHGAIVQASEIKVVKLSYLFDPKSLKPAWEIRQTQINLRKQLRIWRSVEAIKEMDRKCTASNYLKHLMMHPLMMMHVFALEMFSNTSLVVILRVFRCLI